MKSPPSNALLWFGVLGGAAAWTIQFLANLFFTFAQCDPPTARWALPVHAWEIGLSIAAVLVDARRGEVDEGVDGGVVDLERSESDDAALSPGRLLDRDLLRDLVEGEEVPEADAAPEVATPPLGVCDVPLRPAPAGPA